MQSAWSILRRDRVCDFLPNSKKSRPVLAMRNASRIQYSIELPVNYETGPREVASGRGRTLTIGSQVVRFISDQNLRPGRSILLTLAWPTVLPDGTKLNLWMSGTIIRSRFWEVEVRVSRYEFRTRRRSEPARVSVPERRQARLEGPAGEDWRGVRALSAAIERKLN